MKILFLPAYFYPEHGASSYLDQNMKEDFAAANLQMLLYTPVPTRGISDLTAKEYRNKRKEWMYDNHLEVHRFLMFSEGKNPAIRALRYVLNWIIQFNIGLFSKNIDCIFIVSTPPIQGVLGGVLNKLKRVPFVYNLQDIFPDSLAGTGLAKRGGFLWKVGRVIENFTYRNADKIIVISQDFKRNIMAKGVPEDKIEVIYNWVDQNATVPVKNEDNELFEEFGVSRDKFRVVYAGNLGNAQNIELIVNATRKLKDNAKIQFIIFGKGGMEEEIKTTKAKEQLDNLMILPLQPYDRVSKVYGLGNVCIVACKPGLGGAAMPSKTWSIMSSGRAVLANFDEGELKEIVEKNRCGVFTKAGDLEGFVSTIVELSKDTERCEEMGANGRQFILDNLSREVGTQKYIDVIKSVVKK